MLKSGACFIFVGVGCCSLCTVCAASRVTLCAVSSTASRCDRKCVLWLRKVSSSSMRSSYTVQKFSVSGFRAKAGSLIVRHWRQVSRYIGVSVVNVATSLGTLVICHAVLGWSAKLANVAAWLVSTFLAYFLSKMWVWREASQPSQPRARQPRLEIRQPEGQPRQHGGFAFKMSREAVIFYVMAFAGLLLSIAAIEVVILYTNHTVYLAASYLGVHGVLWVAKYLFCDQVIWRR